MCQLILQFIGYISKCFHLSFRPVTVGCTLTSFKVPSMDNGGVLMHFIPDALFILATLTLYHGRTSGSYLSVEGVAVLNIGSGTSHVFDCVVTEGNVANLRWEKAEGVQTFPVTTETVAINEVDMMVKRLNIGVDPPYSEVGVYSCINGDETASINITGGIININLQSDWSTRIEGSLLVHKVRIGSQRSQIDANSQKAFCVGCIHYYSNIPLHVATRC